MYNIIPLILIIFCLIVIIAIVTRKFSVLASLDVANIPAEREAVFKEQIIGKRLKRNFFKYYSRIIRLIKPAGEGAGKLGKWIYRSLLEFKENYNKEKVVKADSQETVKRLTVEAEEMIKDERLDEAEKKLIEVISLDSKSTKAFRSLGELYYKRKNYPEAKQTLEHALKLLEKDFNIYGASTQDGRSLSNNFNSKEDINNQMADIYFDLALINKEADSIKEALANIRQALRIIPNNPRYLDTKLELSIIKGDKGSALSTWEKLKKVNPDNQKLDDFKKKISEL